MAKKKTKAQIAAEEKKAASRYAKAGQARKRAEGWRTLKPSRRKTPKIKDYGSPDAPFVFEDCNGQGCRTRPPKGAPSRFKGFNYTTPSVRKGRGEKVASSHQPCAATKTKGLKACPVQMVFIDGDQYLRLCRERNKPGFVVPVRSATHASKLGAKLCKCWHKHGGSFERCVKRDTGLGRGGQ